LITILSEETSIVDSGSHSVLELTWKLDSRFGVASVEVYLDSSMYAIPVSYQDGVSVELTYGVPSLSLQQPGPVVSENRKIVTFKIHNVSLHLNAKGGVQRKQIPFEWRNPGHIPEKVEIGVAVKSLFLGAYTERLVGFNTRTGIIKFLTQRNDSSFHFPKLSPVYSVPYWEFSKDAALYQSGPDTTVKSVTWPTELPYWHSPEGEQYLASQIRKIDLRQHPSTVPVRIAMCPFELDMPASLTTLFLQEMEVHSRLGVRVHVISPKDLSGVVDDKNSIALYGGSLGLDFQGTDSELSAGALSLMLDSHRIRDLERMYEEIYQLSTPWVEYKKRRGITFSDEASGIWIFNRVRYLKRKFSIGHEPGGTKPDA
jgi:hypothetical protein